MSTVELVRYAGTSILSSVAQKTNALAMQIESKIGLYRSVLFLSLLTWGLWLAFPWWETFRSTPSFRIMGSLADEWVWGCLFVITGLVGMLSTLRGMFRVSQYAMLSSAVLWFTVSGTFIASNFYSTASVIYPVVALLCCINYYLVEVKGALSNEQ